MSLLGRAITEAQAEKRANIEVKSTPPSLFKLNEAQQKIYEEITKQQAKKGLPLISPRAIGRHFNYNPDKDAAIRDFTRPKPSKRAPGFMFIDEAGMWYTYKWYRHPFKWFTQQRFNHEY